MSLSVGNEERQREKRDRVNLPAWKYFLLLDTNKTQYITSSDNNSHWQQPENLSRQRLRLFIVHFTSQPMPISKRNLLLSVLIISSFEPGRSRQADPHHILLSLFSSDQSMPTDVFHWWFHWSLLFWWSNSTGMVGCLWTLYGSFKRWHLASDILDWAMEGIGRVPVRSSITVVAGCKQFCVM